MPKGKHLNSWKHLKHIISNLHCQKWTKDDFKWCGCWRAKCPTCYSRVNYSVVCPPDKLKPRGQAAKVTFGSRLVWGRAAGCAWWWLDEYGGSWWAVGESHVWLCRKLMDSLPQTGPPLWPLEMNGTQFSIVHRSCLERESTSLPAKHSHTQACSCELFTQFFRL